MAIGEAKGANAGMGGRQPVSFVSPYREWVDANTDLEHAMADSEIREPSTIADSAVTWIKVGEGVSSALLRAKYTQAISAAATSPGVRVVGAWLPNKPEMGIEEFRDTYSSTFSSDSTADNYGVFLRLDNADNDDATETTISIDPTHDFIDDDFKYSDPTSLTNIDLQGCQFVTVFCTTAASVTGTGTLTAQLGLV